MLILLATEYHYGGGCPLLSSFSEQKKAVLQYGKRTPVQGLLLVQQVLSEMDQAESASIVKTERWKTSIQETMAPRLQSW